jgi:putative acetyltransferase
MAGLVPSCKPKRLERREARMPVAEHIQGYPSGIRRAQRFDRFPPGPAVRIVQAQAAAIHYRGARIPAGSPNMSASSTIEISPARLPDDIETVRGLFAEYVDSLGIDLSFQDVGAELAQLPGKHAPPRGVILIARDGAGAALGCVALRPWSQPGVCEIKRLYVRPAARGQALGRRLAEAVIAWAARAGYVRVLLDTLASMQAARQLCVALGFRPVAAYYDNPVPGTLYMALELEPGTA